MSHGGAKSSHGCTQGYVRADDIPRDELTLNKAAPRTKRLRGAWRDLWLALAVITIPMTVLPSILLGFIFKNLVFPTPGLVPDLALPGDGAVDSAAYWVNFRATALVAVASWASSLAPLITQAVMLLQSYPAAQQLIRTSTGLDATKLPTPYQLNLFLSLQTGSVSSLLAALKYRFWPNRARLAFPVQMMLFALACATLLGYVIIGADTWLHVATDTTILSTITPGVDHSTYGRYLAPACIGSAGNSTSGSLCQVTSSSTNDVLSGATVAYQTLSNSSTNMTIANFDRAGQTYFYLMPANLNASIDYRATTLAISTQCSSATQQCGLLANGAAMTYNCSAALNGNIGVDNKTSGDVLGTSHNYFRDANLSQPITADADGWLRANPFYLGTTNIESVFMNEALKNDSINVTPLRGGSAWIVSCKNTVYDLEYSWINGSVANQVLRLANTTVGGTLLGPMQGKYAFADIDLRSAAQVATLSANGQQLCDSYSKAVARETLGLSAGMMVATPTLREQVRGWLMVSRVPKIPLYLLVVLSYLYAAVGVLLALVAAKAASEQTKEVHARLSTAGMTAAGCEATEDIQASVKSAEDLFSERRGGSHRRVRIVHVESGGWKYEVVSRDQSTP